VSGSVLTPYGRCVYSGGMGVYPLRLSDERRASWQLAADRERRSLAEWIRLVCDDAAALAAGTVGATGLDRQPQAEPIGHGAEETEGPGRVELGVSAVPAASVVGPSRSAKTEKAPVGGKPFKGPDWRSK
jgi:hypothetical protein